MAIAKVAVAGVGVVGMATAATIAMVSSSEERGGRALSDDKEFAPATDGNAYKGKGGENRAKYLLGVGTAKDAAKVKDNKTGGEKKFAEYFGEGVTGKPTTGKFKDVVIATGTAATGKKSLSQVCDEAYKEQEANVKNTNTDESKFDLEQVGKYCSPYTGKITTIEEKNGASASTYSSGTHGCNTTGKKNLVSADSADENKGFGDMKQEELKANKKGSAGDSTKNEFKKLSDKLNSGTSTTDNLRTLCNTSYGKNETSDAETHPKEEVYKFCSLSGTAPASAA